jgi:hypothetical protein
MDVTGIGATDRTCWIWFADEPFRPVGYDTANFKEARMDVRRDGLLPQPFATLFSELRLSDAQLMQRLTPGKQRDVKIARNRGWAIVMGNDDNAISRFYERQTVFAAQKGIYKPLELSILLRNASHSLAAYVQDKNGNDICWNYYAIDPPISRLWFAGSALDSPKADRGYAATLLHWEMMLHFRKLGFEIYDWGGINLDPTAPTYSITQFKASFGGIEENRFDYHCRWPVSRIQRVWRRLFSLPVELEQQIK